MQITSTTYMDFLLHTGLARLRVVKGARRQYELGYTQGGDRYRRIRNGIAALHRAGDGIESLWDIVEAAPAAKRDSFTRVAADYGTVLRSEALSFVAMWNAVGQQVRLAERAPREARPCPFAGNASAIPRGSSWTDLTMGSFLRTRRVGGVS